MAGVAAVSARDRLFGMLWGNYTSAEKNEALDAFAHELAERIRDGYTGDGPDEDNWILSAFDAAKLIDPEYGP